MNTLNEKVENYIIENTSSQKGVKVKEIFAYFQKQGYSKEEISNAMKAFSKKRCSFTEYDT